MSLASEAVPLPLRPELSASRPARGPLIYLAAALLAVAWAVHGFQLASQPAYVEPRFAITAPVPSPAGLPVFTEAGSHTLPVPEGKPSSHSSAIVLDEGGQGRRAILAFWYAGAREGGADVEIISSRFDLEARKWSQPQIVLNRHVLARALGFGVRRLGNPVGWIDSGGRSHLFAVGTGMSGWATSRVIHLVSSDGGKSFDPVRVLPLSPLFNISNLVRNPAVPMADGGALVPLYFDMGNKYPVAMRVSSLGEPVEVVRMSHDDEALQPAVVALDSQRAIGLLRDPGIAGTLKLVSTGDGGRTWRDEGATNLENPNSSVAVARLADGTLVAAVNPSREGRGELVLAVSREGRDWTIIREVVSGTDKEEYSYPSILVDGDEIHLTYTHKRQGIEHRIYRVGGAP